MKRTLTWGMVVMLGIACAWADETPAAGDILKQMAETASKVEKMSFSITTKINTPMGVMNIPSDLKMQRPNRMRSETKAMMMKTTSVCDGEFTWVYIPMRNVYFKQKAPAGFDMEGTMGNMGAPDGQRPDLFWMLLDRNSPDKITGLAGKASLLGDETVDGLACYHLKVETATDVQSDIWADKEKNLIRRVQLDMYQLMKAAGDKMGSQAVLSQLKPGQMMMTMDFHDYNLDPTFEAGTFKFTPPAGSREIDPKDLTKILMGGGGGAPPPGDAPARPTRRAPSTR